VVSWEPNRKAALWGRTLIHDRIVAENAGVRTQQEVIADVRIGGEAVDRMYYVDLDRVWETVAARMEMMRRYGNRIESAAGTAPWPDDSLKIRYLSCVPEILQWQATSDAVRRAPSRPEGPQHLMFQDTLADIDAHEQGHVLDAMSYLPVGAHLFEDIGLLLKHGFSAQSLMAMTEHNAQLTALAHAPEPRSILAGAVAFVAKDQELTEHALGYYDLVNGLVRYVADHPEKFPEIDTHGRVLDQFPRLHPEQIRQIAQAVAQQEGLPQRAARILTPDTR
jgi:hypothetical protein